MGIMDNRFIIQITAILGIISLMGIIMRNTIMIFDHAENLRKNHRNICLYGCFLKPAKEENGAYLPYFRHYGYRYSFRDCKQLYVVETDGYRYFLRYD